MRKDKSYADNLINQARGHLIEAKVRLAKAIIEIHAATHQGTATLEISECIDAITEAQNLLEYDSNEPSKGAVPL